MALGRLKDYLVHIGSHVHDVFFLDVDGNSLSEDDLRKLDFDNLIVLDADNKEEYGDGEQESDKWIVANLTLDVKKAAKI